jgi:hypothetical protein
MKRTFSVPLIASLFIHLTAVANWSGGTAKIKITPEKPLVMSGYASRTTPFKSIARDIWAKALILEDEKGKRVAIITTDLVGIYSDISPAIYAGITDRTGIDRADVLLTWSHTHSGPRLTLEEQAHAGTTEENRKDAVAYTKHLQEQLVQLVEQASQNLQAVDLSWGRGFASFVMNRRGRTPRGVRLSPNPSGHVDRSLPCLKVNTEDGKLMATLFQVACHNTTLTGNNYALCGDYSGFAQAEVEESYPGANAMFMTGCAGNANPYPRGTLELAKQHGEEVGKEVIRLLQEELTPVTGPLTTALDNARLTLQAQKSIAELEAIAKNGDSWLKGNAITMLDVLRSGGSLPSKYDAPVSVWQFGNDLTLVGMSGEVVSGYVLATQSSIGHQKLWIGAYCHDYFGYLPTAQILREGGYETRGLFNGLGWFDEQAETDMVDTVTRLAKEVGRTFE